LLRNGVFIFADVERLAPQHLAFAVGLHGALKRRGDAVRLLNDPERVLSRYELLRALHERGINRFDVHRPSDPRAGIRYPVFVRHAREHEGTYSPLLENEAALEAALAALVEQGRDLDALLIVEFVDTFERGAYRKYSASYVAGRLVPHHLLFSKHWHVKKMDLVTPELAAEERRYQEENPHRDELESVFRLAAIDYGRIDYGVVDGRIQIWEINTNPSLLKPKKSYQKSQLASKLWLAEQMNQCFAELDALPYVLPVA
jgi:hypothetical protein